MKYRLPQYLLTIRDQAGQRMTGTNSPHETNGTKLLCGHIFKLMPAAASIECVPTDEAQTANNDLLETKTYTRSQFPELEQ